MWAYAALDADDIRGYLEVWRAHCGIKCRSKRGGVIQVRVNRWRYQRIFSDHLHLI